MSPPSPVPGGDDSSADSALGLDQSSDQSMAVAPSSGMKKRKQRCKIPPGILKQLEVYYAAEPKPKPSDVDEISRTLAFDREVVRGWFINRRQRSKNQESAVRKSVPNLILDNVRAIGQHIGGTDEISS